MMNKLIFVFWNEKIIQHSEFCNEASGLNVRIKLFAFNKGNCNAGLIHHLSSKYPPC